MMGSVNLPFASGVSDGETPSARPTRVRYLVLAAGCSMALLAYAHRLGFAIYAPEIKRDFGLSDQQVAYLMSAFLIAYAAFQVPAGLAGDRLGARLLLPLFVVGWSLVTAVIALVPAVGQTGEQFQPFLLEPLILLPILLPALVLALGYVLALGPAGPEPARNPGMHPVDGGPRLPQRRDLGWGLAYPQPAQGGAGHTLAGSRPRMRMCQTPHKAVTHHL